MMRRQSRRGDENRSVVVEGKRLYVTYAELRITEVHLDARNPRINYQRPQKDGHPDKPGELRDFVLNLPGVSDLFKGIRDNGGLIDPILVDAEGKIVEGNCRTAVFMKLRELMPDDSRWAKIPALVLPRDTTEREVAVLQGMYHVNGKIQWRAYLQAAHLHDMETRLKMDAETIGKSLSIQERVVKRLLKAYHAITEHLPQVKTGRRLEAFSHFEEFFKHRKLEEFRKDERNVKIFAKLVKEKKIPLGQNVRDLPAILARPSAYDQLLTSGYTAAMQDLGTAEPSKVYPLFKQLRHTRELLEGLQAQDLVELRKQTAQQDEIRGVYEAIKKVGTAAQIDLG